MQEGKNQEPQRHTNICPVDVMICLSCFVTPKAEIFGCMMVKVDDFNDITLSAKVLDLLLHFL